MLDLETKQNNALKFIECWMDSSEQQLEDRFATATLGASLMVGGRFYDSRRFADAVFELLHREYPRLSQRFTRDTLRSMFQ